MVVISFCWGGFGPVPNWLRLRSAFDKGRIDVNLPEQVCVISGQENNAAGGELPHLPPPT